MMMMMMMLLCSSFLQLQPSASQYTEDVLVKKDGVVLDCVDVLLNLAHQHDYEAPYVAAVFWLGGCTNVCVSVCVCVCVYVWAWLCVCVCVCVCVCGCRCLEC